MSDELDISFTSEEIDQLTQEALSRHEDEDKAIEELAIASGYIKIPPTIDEFIDNEYYAGKFLGPKSPTRLYDFHRDVLREVYPHPLLAKYKEVIYTGPIGAGKSTSCSTGMLYDLCRMLHLKDPHATYRVGFADEIVIAFINTTQSQAEAKQYNQFIQWILTSPFFKERLVDIKKNVNDKETPVLPHLISVVPGSRGGQFLGGAVAMCLLSELNFQGEAKKDQAFKNYETVSTRWDSRFQKGEDRLPPPGRLWLDSSKSDETGWLEQKISSARHDPNVLMISEPVWKVVPSWKRKYSDEKFPVFPGNESAEPRLLREDEVDNYHPGCTPDCNSKETGCPILWVPMDYHQKFTTDLYGGLRDVAGVSTWLSHVFIPQKHLIQNALCLPNIAPTLIKIDFDLADRLINHIPEHTKLTKGVKYFAHWDIATSGDYAGFALTRTVGPVVVPKFSEDFTSTDLATEMGFQTDLAIAVTHVPGKVMPISSFKNLILDLIKSGISIVGVSADGHQSQNLLQDLQLSFIPTKKISTDTTRGPMDLLRDCIVEQRWRGPKHPILETEIKALIDHGKDGIDHPHKGSKDVVDAVAGSLFYANSMLAGAIPPVAIRQNQERRTDKIEEIDPVRAELLRLAGKSMKDAYPKTAKKRNNKENPNDPLSDEFKNAWRDRKPWQK